MKGNNKWNLGVARESITGRERSEWVLRMDSGLWLWGMRMNIGPVLILMYFCLWEWNHRRWGCLWIMRRVWSPSMMWSPDLISTLTLASLSLIEYIHICSPFQMILVKIQHHWTSHLLITMNEFTIQIWNKQRKWSILRHSHLNGIYTVRSCCLSNY